MGNSYSTTNTTDRERGKHLNFEDRCTIKVCKKLGFSLRRIADLVNCSPSTIMYELRRGIGQRKGNRGRYPEYSAKRGQQTYESNRVNCHKSSKVSAENPFVVWVIDRVQTEKWSLDACVGYAKKHALFPEAEMVCTKTLYNAVWNGIMLSPFDLPEALNRSTKKHGPRKNKRVLGTSIDERPKEFSNREEFGHWEIDTVVGHKSGKESVVLTLVEKVTDFYIAIKIPGKTSEAVNAAMEVLREEYGEEYFGKVFKSITSDNGSEFERLSELELYGTKVYFAHPYSSWERAQNERHNRIFRRYVPKGVSIDNYSSDEILYFADAMNALPRKLLGYATPEELFDTYMDQIYQINTVAANIY